MKLKCPKCKEGTVREDNPGVDWDTIGDDCIARNDLICDECEAEFNIFFQFDRMEDSDGNDYDKIEELDS